MEVSFPMSVSYFPSSVLYLFGSVTSHLYLHIVKNIHDISGDIWETLVNFTSEKTGKSFQLLRVRPAAYPWFSSGICDEVYRSASGLTLHDKSKCTDNQIAVGRLVSTQSGMICESLAGFMSYLRYHQGIIPKMFI